MKSLIEHWGRELAYPERQRPVIENPMHFYKFVNQYNGIKNIFFSLYNCDKFSNFDNCIIDKLVFDFDLKNKSLEKIKSIIPLLKKLNYKFSIVFSGNKGFHLYIFTHQTKDINNRYHTLYNAHRTIMEKLNLTTDDIDSKLIGDIKRIIRCPNTMHLKSRLYAIPLSVEEVLTLSYKEIKELAKVPRLKFYIFGKIKFSLEKLDYTPRRAEYKSIPEHNYDIKLNNITDEKILSIVENMHPCVKMWLLHPKDLCKNNSRWFFTIYCRDIGLPSDVINNIAKYFWSIERDSTGHRTKYQEYKQEKQLYYSNIKQDYLMPSCDFLYNTYGSNSKRLCQGKCSKYKRNGFPIYN